MSANQGILSHHSSSSNGQTIDLTTEDLVPMSDGPTSDEAPRSYEGSRSDEGPTKDEDNLLDYQSVIKILKLEPGEEYQSIFLTKPKKTNPSSPEGEKKRTKEKSGFTDPQYEESQFDALRSYDYGSALQALVKKFQPNNLHAYFDLGVSLFRGYGTKKNPVLAYYYLYNACVGPNALPVAQCFLAEALKHDLPTKMKSCFETRKDYKRATFALFVESCKKYHARALMDVATYLAQDDMYYGEVLSDKILKQKKLQTRELAFRLAQVAASLGNPEAQYAVAYCCFHAGTKFYSLKDNIALPKDLESIRYGLGLKYCKAAIAQNFNKDGKYTSEFRSMLEKKANEEAANPAAIEANEQNNCLKLGELLEELGFEGVDLTKVLPDPKILLEKEGIILEGAQSPVSQNRASSNSISPNRASHNAASHNAVSPKSVSQSNSSFMMQQQTPGMPIQVPKPTSEPLPEPMQDPMHVPMLEPMLKPPVAKPKLKSILKKTPSQFPSDEVQPMLTQSDSKETAAELTLPSLDSNSTPTPMETKTEISSPEQDDFEEQAGSPENEESPEQGESKQKGEKPSKIRIHQSIKIAKGNRKIIEKGTKEQTRCDKHIEKYRMKNEEALYELHKLLKQSEALEKDIAKLEETCSALQKTVAQNPQIHVSLPSSEGEAYVACPKTIADLPKDLAMYLAEVLAFDKVYHTKQGELVSLHQNQQTEIVKISTTTREYKENLEAAKLGISKKHKHKDKNKEKHAGRKRKHPAHEEKQAKEQTQMELITSSGHEMSSSPSPTEESPSKKPRLQFRPQFPSYSPATSPAHSPAHSPALMMFSAEGMGLSSPNPNASQGYSLSSNSNSNSSNSNSNSSSPQGKQTLQLPKMAQIAKSGEETSSAMDVSSNSASHSNASSQHLPNSPLECKSLEEGIVYYCKALPTVKREEAKMQTEVNQFCQNSENLFKEVKGTLQAIDERWVRIQKLQKETPESHSNKSSSKNSTLHKFKKLVSSSRKALIPQIDGLMQTIDDHVILQRELFERSENYEKYLSEFYSRLQDAILYRKKLLHERGKTVERLNTQISRHQTALKDHQKASQRTTHRKR